MERVVFLLKDGTRLSCMLNPSSILMRRRAGLGDRSVYSAVGAASGLNDDPLIFTGGGSTELILQLLFDLAVAGSTLQTDDARDLTGPLWRLSEARPGLGEEPRLPVVRLIWGKTWNVPGVVAEVAERLEAFAESGAPRRSLLTMRFLRVSEDEDRVKPEPPLRASELARIEQIRPDTVRKFATPRKSEPPPADRALGGRADVVASRAYRSESLWRLVVAANGILNPLQDLTGKALTLLPRSVLGGTRE